MDDANVLRGTDIIAIACIDESLRRKRAWRSACLCRNGHYVPADGYDRAADTLTHKRFDQFGSGDWHPGTAADDAADGDAAVHRKIAPSGRFRLPRPIVAMLPALLAIAFVNPAYGIATGRIVLLSLLAAAVCCGVGLACSAWIAETTRTTVVSYLMVAAIFVLPLFAWIGAGKVIDPASARQIAAVQPARHVHQPAAWRRRRYRFTDEPPSDVDGGDPYCVHDRRYDRAATASRKPPTRRNDTR